MSKPEAKTFTLDSYDSAIIIRAGWNVEWHTNHPTPGCVEAGGVVCAVLDAMMRRDDACTELMDLIEAWREKCGITLMSKVRPS